MRNEEKSRRKTKKTEECCRDYERLRLITTGRETIREARKNLWGRKNLSRKVKNRRKSGQQWEQEEKGKMHKKGNPRMWNAKQFGEEVRQDGKVSGRREGGIRSCGGKRKMVEERGSRRGLWAGWVPSRGEQGRRYIFGGCVWTWAEQRRIYWCSARWLCVRSHSLLVT